MDNKLADITAKTWILALFIRDDGERLLLGDGWFDFKDSQQHFAPNTMANDVVELQGADGQLLAGQVRRSASQSFDGYIADEITNATTTEQKRREFLTFFRKKHFYTVVYILTDKTAIQRKRGYLTDAPAVQELRQKSPEYHVALAFEDVNYYEYAEDAQGDEIFAHNAQIAVTSNISGGLKWDSDGAVSDTSGYTWEAGSGGGRTIVTNNGIDRAHPVWTITGTAINPSITNLTTGQTMTFNGTVPSGQTLVIDTYKQTATLEGANVFALVSGDWLELATGTNQISYTVTGTTDASTLSWNGIVG